MVIDRYSQDAQRQYKMSDDEFQKAQIISAALLSGAYYSKIKINGQKAIMFSTLGADKQLKTIYVPIDFKYGYYDFKSMQTKLGLDIHKNNPLDMEYASKIVRMFIQRVLSSSVAGGFERGVASQGEHKARMKQMSKGMSHPQDSSKVQDAGGMQRLVAMSSQMSQEDYLDWLDSAIGDVDKDVFGKLSDNCKGYILDHINAMYEMCKKQHETAVEDSLDGESVRG